MCPAVPIILQLSICTWFFELWLRGLIRCSDWYEYIRVTPKRLGAIIWYLEVHLVFAVLAGNFPVPTIHSEYIHARPTNLVAPKELPTSIDMFPKKTFEPRIKLQ